MDGIDERVRDAILRRAEPDGFVPFDRFIEEALYAPAVGYYQRSAGPVGPAGDYLTAAHGSPLFATALAHHLATRWRDRGRSGPLRVAEVGAGDGTLAVRVIEALQLVAEPPRSIEYHLLERSSSRWVEARERAAAAGVGVRSVRHLGELAPFDGSIVAHEFLDALPCRRLLRRGREWLEMGVRWTGGRFEESDGPAALAPPGVPLPLDAPDGTILEISPVAEAFVREVADSLVSGEALFIDYGAPTTYWLGGAGSGTLQAFRDHHTVLPWEQPGAADLTAWVNFDRIRAAVTSARLLEISYRPQRDALIEWGLPGILETAQKAATSEVDRVRLHFESKSLLFGFGNFHVLEVGTRPSNS